MNEEGDITFRAAIVTLAEGTTSFLISNFTELKKGLHIANFSVFPPEQMKHVKPKEPVFTCHLLNESEENASNYVSSLIKANKNNGQYEQYWLPTPENPGDKESHTPILARILRKRNLQEVEKLDPHEDEASRQT